MFYQKHLEGNSMELGFLDEKFNEERFEEFVESVFDDFDKLDTRYKDDDLSDEDKNHIVAYKYLGDSFLDDNSEIGVLILKSATKNIENKRVGFSKVISKLANPHGKETVLIAIYHDDSPVWRLTFVSYDIKDGKQSQKTDAKRYTYVLGEEIATKTAKEQIGELFTTNMIKQSTLEEVFSVEKVSKEFFDKYKKLYFETLDYLRPQVALFSDDKNLTLFTKKLLGRIVFLYFIQKKGWLGSQNEWGDGDRKFLSQQFENFDGDNFYEEILKPIFFEALNKERSKENYFFKSFGMMPYLNGGLFNPQEIDKDSSLIIENDIFKNIIDTFDQYNFTIIEDTPHESEVAIDPEMLGRIFEDLLEDRKEKGAFYTPREIVHYMCQESIKNYLETKPKEEDELEYLKNIKVLDPAIGSGAFPMGMLHEIIEKRVSLGDSTKLSTMKKEIIQNSIYGVDIEPSAVEIAKLRFWLSIVVDDESPMPLPNLAYKIMVGNSLIETINGLDPLVQNQNKKAQKEIKILQSKFKEYFSEHNSETKNKIDAEVKEAINLILTKTAKNFDIQPKLEMNRKEQKKYEEDYINNLLLKKVQKEYNEHNYTQELFFYKIYFADIINSGGFDVLIGNPPYVRHEKIKELKPKLKIEGYKSYNGTADLYIYFFEQGYRLLKDGGILSFITSNKWTRAKYGKQFRDFILKNTNILDYIDFNGVKVFESATVDTSIMSYRKSKNRDNSFIYCDINEKYKKESELDKFIAQNSFEYSQNDLSADSFSFLDKEELAIKKKIEKIGTPLKDCEIEINRGITTGFNEAFIIDSTKKDELIARDKKSSEIIKPLLRGRDIRKYSYKFADKWLINTHNNPPVDIAKYPAIKEHLDGYIDKLRKRSDKGITLYNLRNCAFLNEFEKEKIIFSKASKEQAFCYDNKYSITLNTTYIATGKNLKFILAILNSKTSQYIFLKFLQSGGIEGEITIQAIEKLPIPEIPKEQQKPFEILVDYIMFAKEQNMNLEASLFESIIDGMVYDLYFEEEMKEHNYYTSDEVTKIVKEFDNSLEMIEKMYGIFKENKVIQRGLVYRGLIKEIKIINGADK